MIMIKKKRSSLLINLDKKIELIEKIMIIATFCFSFGLITLNVILRYFFKMYFGWALETAIYSMILTSFFAISYAVGKNNHISLTILQDNIRNPKILAMLSGISNVISLIFFTVMFGLWVKYIIVVVIPGKHAFISLYNIPMTVIFIPISISFLFGVFNIIKRILKSNKKY